jgi:hypothetical protein
MPVGHQFSALSYAIIQAANVASVKHRLTFET